MRHLNAQLGDWQAIKDRGWDSLLAGNGASLAVWPGFGYGSLVKQAPLSRSDCELFEALGTTNFESALDALRVARVVCRQAGHDDSEVYARYRAIRRALIKAVREVHVPWSLIPQNRLQHIRSTLRSFTWVYTTDYDLLFYWAIMSNDARGFRDFFWASGNTFNISDTDTSSNLTKILYLHGALHLYRREDGAIAKRTATAQNLLDTIARPDAGIPLFVSEGRSADKQRAIRRSDYLSFANRTFSQDSGPLVVFGHSLSSQDEHLLKAIDQPGRRVAISLLPGTNRSVLRRKAELTERLPHARVSFFDATTHPLGDRAQIQIPILQ
jgi:hypothetical protein